MVAEGTKLVSKLLLPGFSICFQAGAWSLRKGGFNPSGKHSAITDCQSDNSQGNTDLLTSHQALNMNNIEPNG